MSLPSLTNQLITVLEQQGRRLDELEAAMADQRTAFLGTNSHELDTTSAELTGIATRVAGLENVRQNILVSLLSELGLQAETSLREIIGLLPRDLRHRLEQAACQVRQAAQKVRVANAVGTKLLELSHQFHEGLYRDLSHLCDTPHKGYGPQAVTNGTTTKIGRLIDGTI